LNAYKNGHFIHIPIGVGVSMRLFMQQHTCVKAAAIAAKGTVVAALCRNIKIGFIAIFSGKSAIFCDFFNLFSVWHGSCSSLFNRQQSLRTTFQRGHDKPVVLMVKTCSGDLLLTAALD
jgi:hypothetical protein